MEREKSLTQVATLLRAYFDHTTSSFIPLWSEVLLDQGKIFVLVDGIDQCMIREHLFN